MSEERTTIYLIRHGESHGNASGRVQGQTDFPLTDLGRAQARRLAERLASAGIELIYSSDLSRARETAEIVTQRLGLSVITDRRLREIDFGLASGLTFEEIADRWPQMEATSQAGYDYRRGDMESSAYTDRTLAIVRCLHAQYPRVSTVIQAYLKRSEADVRALIHEEIALRLVKGAYDEPATIAFRDKRQVDACLIYLIKLMLSAEAQARGVYTAVASHDDQVIAATEQYARQYSIARDRWEFQMLYGIRRDRQLQLAHQGYTMRLYVPYGTHWYPYFMRRLAERPANLLFFLRALAGR